MFDVFCDLNIIIMIGLFIVEEEFVMKIKDI